MRSALIIGAGGQDGCLLAPLLLGRGYGVRGWTRTEPPATAPCECEVIDISELGAVDAALRRLPPDEIYYLAAFHHSAEDRIEESASTLLRRSFDVHVLGLLNVLQVMEECCQQARLFYAGSSHVFGRPSTEWQNEKTPFLPDSAYGVSKAAGIQCCQYYRREKGIFAATGILFNHESPLRKPSFLSQKIVRGALEARRNPAYRLVLGDLEATVDCGYAPDYVDAMFRILQLAEANDFVIASGEIHSVREFTQAAFGALGLDWRLHVETDPRLLNRVSHPLRGDSTKLRAATGWSPTVGFGEMVAGLVREAKKTDEILQVCVGK